MSRKLTEAGIRRLSKTGKYSAGEGLYLRVANGGSKSWILRITENGKRRDVGLGGWPEVDLAKAREKAGNRRGSDRKASVPTFAEAYEELRIDYFPSLRPSTVQHWEYTMNKHVLPVLGKKRLDDIERSDVVALLRPLGRQSISQMWKARQHIRKVLGVAVAQSVIQHNVAGDEIKHALPAGPEQKNLAAVPYDELKPFLAELDAGPCRRTSKLMMRFVALTACRGQEARGATWDEIDLDAARWIIPPERMKMGREHRVPLSPEAMAILDEAEKHRQNGVVFPSDGGRPYVAMALPKMIQRYSSWHGRATAHGLRSTFRDWCAEHGKDRQDAEAALAHSVPGVEGRYFRTDLFDRRRGLMNEWGRFVGAGALAAVSVPTPAAALEHAMGGRAHVPPPNPFLAVAR